MNNEILYLSATYGGSVHDKSICNQEKLTISKSVLLFVDLGFQGLSGEKAQIIIPHKHKKNKELTVQQKEHNTWVSRIRVKIEHIIGAVKNFRKVKETFRGRLYAREDTIMLVACALHNLKQYLKWNT